MQRFLNVDDARKVLLHTIMCDNIWASMVEAGIEGAEPPYRGSEKIASKGITLVRLNKVRKALKRF